MHFTTVTLHCLAFALGSAVHTTFYKVRLYTGNCNHFTLDAKRASVDSSTRRKDGEQKYRRMEEKLDEEKDGDSIREAEAGLQGKHVYGRPYTMKPSCT
jgi:hypothetical protein